MVETTVNRRPLGQSGIEVSEIGFGTWGIGGATKGATSYGKTDDKESLTALAKAFDLGITLYDTANAYGDGHAEELLGTAFKGKRDKVVLATKAGFVRWGEPQDFSVSAIRNSLEGSLQRLRTDYIDLLQLHNPGVDRLNVSPEIAQLLAKLKQEGKVRAFGLSAKSPKEALECLKLLKVDSLQVNINMLDIRALDCGLLDKAQEIGVGVIARTPLCFGFLSGAINEETQFGTFDHRSAWSLAQRKAWSTGARSVAKILGAGKNGQMATDALRFCLSLKGVASVIPGILRASEAQTNSRASFLGPLPNDKVEAIIDLNRNADFFVRNE